MTSDKNGLVPKNMLHFDQMLPITDMPFEQTKTSTVLYIIMVVVQQICVVGLE